MEGMKQYPDKYFDLAIVDVPYGIGIMDRENLSRGKQAKAKNYKLIPDTRPEPNYFDELFRVSKNQIIWGANHFISNIPLDSPCWIVWDKIIIQMILPIVNWLGHRLKLQLGSSNLRGMV